MLFRYESNNLMQQATNQVICFIMQQTCHFFGRILRVGDYGPKYIGRFGPLPQMIGSPVYF